MMRRAWLIARTDLTVMLRQRETVLWVFLMPMLFFYFIGTVTGGFGGMRGSAARPDLLALRAPADAGVLGPELVRRLEEQNYRVVQPSSEEEFRRHARRLIIPGSRGPGGLTEEVFAGRQVRLSFERDGDPTASMFDRVRVSRAVYAVLADVAVLRLREETADPANFKRLAEAPRVLTLEVSSAGRRQEPPVGFAQAVPGTMVMFTMLVLLTSGAIMLVVERRQGLLRRLASTPVSRGEIVLGKWTGRMALALVQLAFAMLVGTVLFGVQWGSAIGMVVLVLVAWAAFNASLALLLGSLARSEPQMAGIGVVTTMALAALGGCWWPIEVAPPWMQSLAMFLPTGWAMDALHRLVNFDHPAVAAAPHIAALGVSALALGWAATRAFRYQG